MNLANPEAARDTQQTLKSVLCLCREEHDYKLIPGYAEAFRRRGIQFICVDDSERLDVPLSELLKKVHPLPSAILHFESAHPLFPIGLEQSPVPTVCFHADTYAFTRRRIAWSSVFDHVAVFHSGYQEQFAQAGHSGAFLLPHAVRSELFMQPDRTREYEIGWVGQLTGPFYRKREKWLLPLARQFKTNDWTRSMTIPEVADVYRRSRIVVNIGRDDFPQDANLRTFEVLAAGALLLTELPSELTDFGFKEGEHFVGYRDPADILSLIRQFLQNEGERSRIAGAGRELVLAAHTYDNRVVQVLARLKDQALQKRAPARAWSDARCRLAALDFYSAHVLPVCAMGQFVRVFGRDFAATRRGTSLVARAWFRWMRAKMPSL